MKFISQPKSSLLIISWLIFCSSCSYNLNYTTAKTRNQNKFRKKGMIDEVMFIMEVKSSTILIKDLSLIAKENGSSAMVLQLAGDLYSSYSTIETEVKEIATREGIRISDQMNTEHWSAYHKINGNNSDHFEEEYVSLMTQVNKKLWEGCRQMEENAKSKRIREFVTQRNDFFKEYYERSQKLLTRIKDLK